MPTKPLEITDDDSVRKAGHCILSLPKVDFRKRDKIPTLWTEYMATIGSARMKLKMVFIKKRDWSEKREFCIPWIKYTSAPLHPMKPKLGARNK
jgi:hypothetical protein